MPSTFNGRNAEAYERVMGRWSRRLAEPFLAFAGDTTGCRVLEVGCGTGSLTVRLAACPGLTSLTAIDIVDDYVTFAKARIVDPRIVIMPGDASRLAFADDTFDSTLSLLALHLMTDPAQAVRDMVRVTRPGGVIAGAVWDVVGGLPHARLFLDTAAMVDEAGAAMRASYLSVPLTRAGELAVLWRSCGLVETEQVSVSVRFDFADFADYWEGFLTGEGTMGGYVAALTPSARKALAHNVRAAFEGGARDGPRSFAATAWLCRGIVTPAPPSTTD